MDVQKEMLKMTKEAELDIMKLSKNMPDITENDIEIHENISGSELVFAYSVMVAAVQQMTGHKESTTKRQPDTCCHKKRK